MSDICMCKDEECPLKDKCRRFTTKPGVLQTYFSESPRDNIDNPGVCEYFFNSKR